ncbi:hypothetical protein RI129_009120 [Pyrocoelia pectoralis]|uniref:DHHA2 domain-containing protein n=1 Tax=Pyrocoelia pectoralis TaxID=417401 RepID=A0AAN7ZKR6_9COLE
MVSGELQRQFNISYEPHQRFDQLWHAHNDVSHLTPKQLLFKDLKFLENLPIPGLPMLVREYLLFTNVHEQLISFCDEVNSATVVIMGLKVANDEVFRDIAVFSNTHKKMRDSLVEHLMISTDLGLIEGAVDVPDIRYFTQNNVKMSRKQIIPLIKSIKI